jgi:hypothetical protein
MRGRRADRSRRRLANQPFTVQAGAPPLTVTTFAARFAAGQRIEVTHVDGDAHRRAGAALRASTAP